VEVLFEVAMEYIDPVKQVYDNLFKYFDELVKFEELIFVSASFCKVYIEIHRSMMHQSQCLLEHI